MLQYLVRTDVLKRFRFDEALRGYEDWDLLLRLKLDAVRFASCDRISAIVTDDASDGLSLSVTEVDALIYIYAKYHWLMMDRMTQAIWESKIGRNLRRFGRVAEGRRWIVRSLLSDPSHPRRALELLRRKALESLKRLRR